MPLNYLYCKNAVAVHAATIHALTLSHPPPLTHTTHIHIEGKRKREREIERKRKRERERERVIHTNTDIQDQSHITAYYYIDCVYSTVNHKPSNESVFSVFLFSSQKYFL